ncbi:MAG: TonB-dependent receptor [Bacteroidales bacterium]|nr:TonB-dependent receptor [Bacteroidales bacterium]
MKRILTAVAVLVAACATVFAQGGYQVKGVVVDAQGPVIGATVLQVGTSNGTSTGLDGDYILYVPSADVQIEISCIGYASQTFTASAVPATVVLTEDTEFLDDVVVIGYGTVKKSDLTGSVSTVKADQINKGMISSPAQLLAGKSSGVVVTAGDGMPGSSSTIRIRGGSSLNATNDPLVVVDGLPIGGTGVSGMGDALASINPSDIESFTVRKDASATAIYGSRASNGVIIITTKKGSSANTRPNVTADFTTSISQNAKFLDVLDGDEIRAAMQRYYGDNESAMAAVGTENTDWQKQIWRTGFSYEGNVGVSGNVKVGETVLPYRVSGGYLGQKGTLKTSSMDRGTLAFNLNPQLLDKHLTVSLNGKGMYIKNNFANTAAIGQAVQYDPTQAIYDQDGIHGYRSWGTANTLGTNPVASLNEKFDKADAKRFIGNAQFDYKIHGLEDLRLNLNLGLDFSKSDGTVDILYGSEQSFHSQTEAGAGRHTDYDQIRRDQTLEFYADYNKALAEKHVIDVMAGYSWQHFWHSSNSFSHHALTDEDGNDLGIDLTDPANIYEDSHNKFENYLVSFFGRLNYTYDDRYFATATFRYDGTSRFSNNKWGFFPSVALAWNAKNEEFLRDVNAVSALKVRLSWGQTGQQDVAGDSYPTLPTYTFSQQGSWYYFGDKLIVPIRPDGYNADLRWETTTTYNAGVDLGFLNGRLTTSLDGYYRKTTDLLNYTPVAAGANLKNYLNANIGTLVNKGVELDVNYIVFETRDLSWQVGVNGAFNHQKITKMTTNDGDGYKGVPTGDISGAVGNKIQMHMTGYAPNAFYVYKQIYDEDGKPIMGAYADLNGDGTVDEDDMYYCKDPHPKVTLGFNTSLNYKSWTFAASAHANFGNYVYDNNSSQLGLLSDLWTNNFIANRVPQGIEDGFTKAQYFSDYYIKNASFFKLDNVTTGYTFNLPKEMTLNVFGTVQNVFCLSPYKGIDPEIFNGIDSNLWPRPRTFVLGVKFNF